MSSASSSLLPKIRQTLFFSATMPPEIRRLADAFLMNPKDDQRLAPPASPAADGVAGAWRSINDRGQARGAAPPDPHRGRQERAHLLQPQARRGHPAALAAQARLRCRRRCMATWRRRARTETLDRFKQRRDRAPGGERRGRPRPRHRGAQPRLQFRRARSMPRTTSTASAAPAGRAARVMPSPWPAKAMVASSRRSSR